MLTLHAATPGQYRQALARHRRLLVDYYKEQCPACSMLDLSLRKYAAGGGAQDLVLLKVRLEDLGEAFFREQGLRQTPSLGLHLDGQERALLAGFQSPAQIAAAVDSHLPLPA